MTEIQDKIKAIGALDLTPTAKYVCILTVVHGIGSAKALVEATGLPKSTIYRCIGEIAEKLPDDLIPTVPTSLSVPTHGTDEIPTSPTHGKVAPEIPTHGTAETEPSRACIELPSEVLITEEKKEDSYLSEVPSDQCVKEKPVAKARRRIAYSAEFEAFWQAYPDKSNNSKPNAHREWLNLLPLEREVATQGLTHLAAHCRKNPDYRCVHAERYLKTRRWESYDMRPKVVPIRQPAPPPLSDEEVFRLANSRSWQ